MGLPLRQLAGWVDTNNEELEKLKRR